MKRLVLLSFALACAHLTAASSSAPGGIHLVGSVLISGDAPTNPHAETFIAVNAVSPSQLVATSIAYEDGGTIPAVYASHDAGRTWRRSRTVGLNLSPLQGGDPIVYFTQKGTALFGSIEGMPDGFRIWRSTDGAATWSSVATFPGGIVDRQYLGVDLTSGPYAGRVYAVGPVLVRKLDTPEPSGFQIIATSYSTDDSVTFRPAVFIDVRSEEDALIGIADPLVAREGAVIIPFETVSVRDRSVGQLWTAISRDGGASFLTIRRGPRVGRGAGFRERRTHVARRAAIDVSEGAFANRIYLTWVDFAQNRYDVKVAHSTDLGLTWSAPVTVNDNVTPDDPGNPAIAVNREGVVAVTFNDRRDDPRNECYRLYVSASLDGGETFLPNVQVNSKATCTNAPGNWPGRILSIMPAVREGFQPYHLIDIMGVPERFPNGGDTQGLVAGPDGRFHAAWINGESGVMQLWYTDFTVELGTQPTTPRVDLTAKVSVEIGESTTDFDARSFSISARLRNTSSNSIRGPVVLALEQVDSGLGGLTAMNSDNGLPGKGAIWTFSFDGRSALAPGELSEQRELRWHFDGQIPSEPRARFRGRFRVLAVPN